MLLLLTLVVFSPAFLSAQNTPSFTIEDQTSQFGEVLEVPVTVADFNMIVSTQFTLQWDPAHLRFVGIDDIALDLSLAANFGTMAVSQGYVTYFFEDVTLAGTNLPDEASLFTISLEVIAQPEPGESVITTINFSDTPTLLEVADTSFSAIPADFVGGEITILGPNSVREPNSRRSFAINMVQPNPFRDQVMVQFNMPEADQMDWTLSDAQGKLLRKGQAFFGEGNQQLVFKANEFPAAGTYLLRMQYDQEVRSMRLMYFGQ
jgi:hypothetical protein